jgi:hypothetical protein
MKALYLFADDIYGFKAFEIKYIICYFRYVSENMELRL